MCGEGATKEAPLHERRAETGGKFQGKDKTAHQRREKRKNNLHKE
jgi:hypothetical protein